MRCLVMLNPCLVGVIVTAVPAEEGDISVRVIQDAGERGSLKWLQRAVNQSPHRTIDQLILPRLGGPSGLTWMSPLAEDTSPNIATERFLSGSARRTWLPLSRHFGPRVVLSGTRSLGRPPAT